MIWSNSLALSYAKVLKMVKKEKEDEALQNKLLAALPEAEFKKIRPLLKEVDLELDEVLWEMDEKRRFVYFPTTAMICLLYDSDEGVSIEVGMTGRQGMVGVVTFIGDARMAKRAVVQREGKAFRMKAEDVEKEFATCPDFQDICMCYTQTLIAQISQNAICNRLHSVEQQLCRYLLVNQDNLQTDTFSMTHEQISNVFGVRRESVSLAAAGLKDRGLIEYSRGTLTILDRPGLLKAACECYEVVREQYDRILSKYIKTHGA
ncbi:MAG: Crp/Fnr family transcriptional regulator [Pyrinomonadaceae bacterium]